MSTRKAIIKIIVVVLIAYLAYGVYFYVQDLRYSRLAVHSCPPGVYPAMAPVYDGTSSTAHANEIVGGVPDCPQQTIDLAKEWPTAVFMILEWLPIRLAYSPLGAVAMSIYNQYTQSNPTSLGSFDVSTGVHTAP